FCLFIIFFVAATTFIFYEGHKNNFSFFFQSYFIESVHLIIFYFYIFIIYAVIKTVREKYEGVCITLQIYQQQGKENYFFISYVRKIAEIIGQLRKIVDNFNSNFGPVLFILITFSTIRIIKLLLQ